MTSISLLTRSSSSISNNSTASPAPAPSPSTLSWQSALWALVAITLNTMTQSSPSSNSLFSDPLSLLRASPIYCLADLLVVQLWVLKLAVFSRSRISIVEALRCFRKEMRLEIKEERVSVLTVVLFILGPFPQFVKLNACSGIPWTLAWSWIYMLCYIFTAGSIICGRDKQDYQLLRAGTTLEEDTKGFLKKATTCIYRLAHLVQIGFSIWLIATSLYTYAIHVLLDRTFSFLAAVWVMIVCPLAVLSFYILGGFILAFNGRKVVGLFGVTVGLILVAGFVSLWVFLDDRDRPHFAEFEHAGPGPFTWGSFALWLLVILIFSFVGFALLRFLLRRVGPNLEISLRRFANHESGLEVPIPVVEEPEQHDKVKQVHGQVSCATFELFFAAVMLIFALAYYCQVYDPARTTKPGWVDVFG